MGDVLRLDAEVLSCFKGDEPLLVGDAALFEGVLSLFGRDESLLEKEASRFNSNVSLLADASFFDGDVPLFKGLLLLFSRDLSFFSGDACEGRLGDLLCLLELSSDLLLEDDLASGVSLDLISLELSCLSLFSLESLLLLLSNFANSCSLCFRGDFS